MQFDQERFNYASDSYGPTLGDHVIKEMTEILLNAAHSEAALLRRLGLALFWSCPSLKTKGGLASCQNILSTPYKF